MIRFDWLENSGVSVAAMSDKSDGDCGRAAEDASAAPRFLGALGVSSSSLFRVAQVHGINVVEVDAAQPHPVEADGLTTNAPGVALGVSVADCAPVALFDPAHRALALLHAGREGTFQNISGIGVQTLQRRYGSDPAHLLALIGPCAGACCYEVSPELADIWNAQNLPLAGRRLDIPGANRQQLENAGVFRHNIRVVAHCTVCGDVFFSYRADRTRSRNLVVVML